MYTKKILMTQNPDLSPEVGEDVAATIDDQARRAAIFQAAVGDFMFLAEHADPELLRAVRNLNMNPGTPDSFRHAQQVQKVRTTLIRMLNTLELGDDIVHEKPSAIPTQRRPRRPPIVDVELP